MTRRVRVSDSHDGRRRVLCARRQILLGSLAAPALFGRTKIDRSSISAISGEIARSPQDAIAFARQYGLKWLELRDVPGNRAQNYFFMEEGPLKEAARQK